MRPLLSRAIAASALLAIASPAASSAQEPVLVPRQESRVGMAVRVAKARLVDTPARVIAYGSVVPWQELVIATEPGGLRVLQVMAEVGDRVERGAALARLDAAVLASQAEQANASVAEAEASLRVARQDLRRASELVRSESASRATLDQREASALGAEARLASARGRLSELNTRLAQAEVRAPEAGIVTRRSILPGAVSSAGGEAFRILQDGRVEMEASVAEADLGSTRPGQAVSVVHEGIVVRGTVRRIAPSLDAQRRTGAVIVALPPDAGLKPGMFARAEIEIPVADVVMVPLQAVAFQEGAAYVFVVDPSARPARVRARRVTPGRLRNGMVEIGSGLVDGETVVVGGTGFLSDGDPVRPEEAPPRIAGDRP